MFLIKGSIKHFPPLAKTNNLKPLCFMLIFLLVSECVKGNKIQALVWLGGAVEVEVERGQRRVGKLASNRSNAGLSPLSLSL